MRKINVTITNRPKSDLKQNVKILRPIFTELWAVLDIRVGRFACSCGPFWTRTIGHFGSWAVLVISACTALHYSHYSSLGQLFL